MDFSIDYLYHYTSFGAAKSIIESQELWFSKSENLNDIRETKGPQVYSALNDLEAIDKYLKHYHQISLSVDKKGSKGFDITSMWGHYASKGNGVCIVFDKEKILSEVNLRGLSACEVKYIKKDEVNLFDFVYNSSIYGNVENYLRASQNTLFFTKTKEWESEQEYRIIAIDDELLPLNIKNAIVAVILCSDNHIDFIETVTKEGLIDYSNIALYRYYSGSGGEWNLYDITGQSLKKPIDFDMLITKGIK